VSQLEATSRRARALQCYRVFFGSRPTEIDGVRDLLERAIRWRRLAETIRDPALAQEMVAIAYSYLELAERAPEARYAVPHPPAG